MSHNILSAIVAATSALATLSYCRLITISPSDDNVSV